MSEALEKEVQAESAPRTAAPAPQAGSGGGKWKNMPRKKRRRIIRRIILLLVLIAAGVLAYRHFGGGGSGGETEVITDQVRYGSITATVEGNGLTRAKNSETVSISTPGTVTEVLVTEGQQVTAGTPLFIIDSPAARTAVEKARSDVQGYEKQLAALQKDLAGLNLAAPHGGKIELAEEAPRLNPGDEISKGTVVATLNDDTRLRLTQYYSYAYEGQLYAGQPVDVSIPALMSSIPGTIEAVHMVSRITTEGAKLFAAEILVENEGALTAGMVASATVAAGGETVYPYEPGKLEYYRTSVLKSTVEGTVVSNSLINFLQVSAGQVLLQIDGTDSESEMFTIQQSLDNARTELEKAEKNLANCNAAATIDGTIIGLNLTVGSEIDTQNPLVTISDTSSLTVNATVDERNVGYIQTGMMVDLDQWGTYASGMVESVSLSSTVTNGVATYPMVITADNFEGTLQVNSNITYSLIASQNDNCLVAPIQCVRTVQTADGETATVVYVQSEDRPENAVDLFAPEEDMGMMMGMSEEIPEGYWPVPVEIGISDNYNVEIKSGVEADTVVFMQIQTTQGWG